jgi:hypothetical protein
VGGADRAEDQSQEEPHAIHVPPTAERAWRRVRRPLRLRDRGVQVIAHVSAIVLTPLSPRHAPVDTVLRLPQGFANTLARKPGQVISGIPHVWLGKTMDVEV